RLDSGLDVDLRVVGERSYGAALVYFTGNKNHNIRLRERAQQRGLRISEWGVFREDEDAPGEETEAGGEHDPWAGTWIGGRSEEEIYAAVDLPWIPPELRTDRGEIERAARGE